MQVLILGDDHGQQARLAGAMMKKGFQVICVESAAAASSYIRSEMIDVLILTETRSGRIGQSCACVAESRNRTVSVIVISGRTGAALDELFEDVPQLYGVMGLDLAPGMVAALALASILPQQVGLPLLPGTQVTAQPQVASAERAEQAPLSEPCAGQGAALNRTLIQPRQRPAPQEGAPGFSAAVTAASAPARPVMAGPIADRFVFAAPVAAAPAFAGIAAPASAVKAVAPVVGAADRTAPDRTAPDRTAPDRTAPDRAAPEAPTLPDTGIGPDLAAMERELDLVNHDRPSVLAASIADELPRWSQSAPKLAMLTDWTPTDLPQSVRKLQAAELAAQSASKASPERRLALGTLLQ